VEFENPIVDILTAEERDPVWLIPDMLLQGQLICLAGDAGTGKSYLSYSLAMCVAAGCPALGGLIPAQPPKRVLYFDQENGGQDREKYLRRVWKGLRDINGEEPDLGLLMENFWPMSFILGGEDWADVAAMAIEQIQPHMLIFDTATPCFSIKEENSNGEATIAINTVRKLMALTDPIASAIILKHAKTRTDKETRIRSMRGAKAWKGAADGTMFQVMATGRPRKNGLRPTHLEPDKQRAYGLQGTIYITPKWADEDKHGLSLSGSYSASKEHRLAQKEEEAEIS
jgi:RecA-family ATPase